MRSQVALFYKGKRIFYKQIEQSSNHGEKILKKKKKKRKKTKERNIDVYWQGNFFSVEKIKKK